MNILQNLLNKVWPGRWAYLGWFGLFVGMIVMAMSGATLTTERLKAEMVLYQKRCSEAQGMVVSTGQRLICVKKDAELQVTPPATEIINGG